MNLGRVIKNIEFFAKDTVHRNFLLRYQKISAQPSSAPLVLVVLSTSGIGNAVEATSLITGSYQIALLHHCSRLKVFPTTILLFHTGAGSRIPRWLRHAHSEKYTCQKSGLTNGS